MQNLIKLLPENEQRADRNDDLWLWNHLGNERCARTTKRQIIEAMNRRRDNALKREIEHDCKM